MHLVGGGFVSILVLTAAIVLIGLFTIGLIFARLYHRASKERAFVRTGMGGQKVVQGGGASCCRCSTNDPGQHEHVEARGHAQQGGEA